MDVVVGAVVVAEGKGGSEDGNEGSGGSGGSGGKCGNDAILLDKRGGEEKRENKYKLSKIEDSRRSSGSNITSNWYAGIDIITLELFGHFVILAI